MTAGNSMRPGEAKQECIQETGAGRFKSGRWLVLTSVNRKSSQMHSRTTKRTLKTSNE